MSNQTKIKTHVPQEAQTQAFGEAFSQQLNAGDIVLLQGDLGAGKTFVSQAIAKGLGCTDPATSPTFTLVQEYGGGRLPVYHIDLYRLESLRDLESLGLEEYFDGEGVTLVEWPERLKEAGYPTPSGCWHLDITRPEQGGRMLELSRS